MFQTGAEVFCARLEPAMRLLRRQSFEVVAPCHTLTQMEMASLCRQIERYSPYRHILLVSDPTSISLPDRRIDAVLPWHLGPKALIRCIDTLLRGDANGRTLLATAKVTDEIRQRMELKG